MKLKAGIHPYRIVVHNHRISFRCRYVPGVEEVLVFIHGLACAGDSFRHALDHGGFSDKSLLFLDLVGFGDSAKPEDFSYTMQDQAGLVDDLLAMLPQRNIHLVVHSMGGAVALLLSPQTHARVRSFANIEGNLIGEDCGVLSRGVSAVSYDRYRRRGYPRHLAAFENHDMFRFEKTTPLAIHQSAVSLAQCSDSGELLNRFSNLDCLKGYFYGEENSGLSVLQQLDATPQFMISNSGHGMMIDNPMEFYAKLHTFINAA